MKEFEELRHPSLVAVWPGMGNVAINAGYYLMAKLGMHLESELEARELFEINHVEVNKGIIRMGNLPRAEPFLRLERPERQTGPDRLPGRGPATDRSLRLLPPHH
ncbi:MAG: hypothetical protein GWO24_13995 [Akkermansiaceae bacterium]|nr:hypothetical protein [Akkermansiaceae bacterium]